MLDHLKANNRAWAERMVSADAGFFRRLERQQAPEYLWIGCSDSRVASEAAARQTNNRFRLDDREGVQNRRNQSIERHENQSIDIL